jgi:hypothetical protein
MDAATFKALGHQLVDQIGDLLASVPSRPVTTSHSPSDIRHALGLTKSLPEHGSDPSALLADTAKQLFTHSLINAHPRFFGYITAPPAPIGILGDFLASAVNANVGLWSWRQPQPRSRCRRFGGSATIRLPPATDRSSKADVG